MAMKCNKAIIALAGYGTRRLPITKSIEKSMLPLLNRPFVDYIVEDCIKAGIKDIYFVVSPGSNQLQSYYSHNHELESYLLAKNKPDMLNAVLPPTEVQFHYVEQSFDEGRYGTTIPVALAKQVIGETDEHIAVIMGDQFFYREDGSSELAGLLEAVDASSHDGGLLANPIPEARMSNYGIVEHDENRTFTRIIEHATPADTDSRLNNSSMYVLPPRAFEFIIDHFNTSQDGEYLIIDPINWYVESGGTLYVHEAVGHYMDCGSLETWFEANKLLFENTIDKK